MLVTISTPRYYDVPRVIGITAIIAIHWWNAFLRHSQGIGGIADVGATLLHCTLYDGPG